MTLYRTQLRDAVIAALQASSAFPSQNVFWARTWPTSATDYPAILIYTPRSRKEAVVVGPSEFRTTATFSIQVRVQENDDQTALTSIESLEAAVEEAIFTSWALVQLLECFPNVDSKIDVNAKGREYLGELEMEIDMQFFEAFDPIQTAVPLDSMGIHADMDAPFDPSGTYTPSTDAPAYTPEPAPRTTGPDGRDEGALDITLPQ